MQQLYNALVVVLMPGSACNKGDAATVAAAITSNNDKKPGLGFRQETITKKQQPRDAGLSLDANLACDEGILPQVVGTLTLTGK